MYMVHRHHMSFLYPRIFNAIPISVKITFYYLIILHFLFLLSFTYHISSTYLFPLNNWPIACAVIYFNSTYSQIKTVYLKMGSFFIHAKRRYGLKLNNTEWYFGWLKLYSYNEICLWTTLVRNRRGRYSHQRLGSAKPGQTSSVRHITWEMSNFYRTP